MSQRGGQNCILRRADKEGEPVDRVRVWLGYVSDGRKAYWDPSDPERALANFGTLVTGDPGRGKTQTINLFIAAAAKGSLADLHFRFQE